MVGKSLPLARRPVAGALVVAALAYGVSVAMLPVRSFWGNDTENKFLVLHSLVESGYRDFSIRLPGRALDPDLEFNPLPPPWCVVRDGKLYSVYPPVFSLVQSIPFRAFGFPGLHVLPLGACLLMLFGVARIARRLSADGATAALAAGIAGLCTPVWFYALNSWEHCLGACAATWSVDAWLAFAVDGGRRHLARAGAFAGIGIWFRDELYIFAALQAMLLVARRERRKAAARSAAAFLLAVLAALLPLWLLQGWALGQPFGFHLGTHAVSAAGLRELLATRGPSLHALLVACSGHAATSLALSAPCLLAFFVYPRCSERVFRYAVPVLALLAMGSVASVAWGYVTGESSMAWTYRTNSLFSTTPVLALAFVRRTSDALARRARDLALVYALLYTLLAPSAMSYSGIHWGNRFLLVLYPLLAPLAASNLSTWWREARSLRLGRGAIVLAVAASFLAQCGSVLLLKQKMEFTDRLNRTVASHAAMPIVTDVWWVPQELFDVFFERPIFLVDSPAKYDRLVTRLADRGEERYLIVTQVHDLPDVTFLGRVDDGRLGLLGVYLFEAGTSP